MMRRATDNPTIADFIPRSYLRAPDIKMTWEEYLALPGGLHDARAKKAGQYRFPGRAVGIDQYAVPMIATLQNAEPTDEGVRETWKHSPAALSKGIFANQAILLTETASYNTFTCMYGEVEFTA